MSLTIEIEPQSESRLRVEAEQRGVFIEEEIGRRLFFPMSIEGELMEDDSEFPIVEESSWGHRTHFGVRIILPENRRMNGGQRLTQFALGAIPISLVGYVADQTISSRPVVAILILISMAPALLFAVGAMHWWRNRPSQVQTIESLAMPLTIEIKPQIETRLRVYAEQRGISVEAEAARRLSLATLTDEERENMEDELDIAAANRAREEDRANPNTRKTLDDLRRARVERAQ